MATPLAKKVESAPGKAPAKVQPVDEMPANLNDLLLGEKADKFAGKFSYQQHPDRSPSLPLKVFAESLLTLQREAANTNEPLDDALLWRIARAALLKRYPDDPLFEVHRKNLALGRMPDLNIEEFEVGQGFYDVSFNLQFQKNPRVMKQLNIDRQNSQFLLKNLGLRK